MNSQDYYKDQYIPGMEKHLEEFKAPKMVVLAVFLREITSCVVFYIQIHRDNQSTAIFEGMGYSTT